MLKNLEIPPSPKHLSYLQADHIEFRCLSNHDRTLTKGDILSFFKQDAELNDDNKFDEISEEEYHGPDEEDFISDEEDFISDEEYKISDEQLDSVDDWFKYLEYRARAFEDTYPFTIDTRLTTLEVKRNLNEHQKLYVFLLIASSLRHFEQSETYRITESFEKISARALQSYFGDVAEIHLFGANTASRYKGDKNSKIDKLSKDLCENKMVSDSHFNQNDSGDQGLDIVGWIPMADCNHGRLMIFGQCACGRDWQDKQHSSSYDKWSRLIDLSVRPVNTIFVPYCFRNASGNWYANNEIQMSLMIDRLRIVKLCGSLKCPLDELSSEVRRIVDDTISYRYDY